MAEPRSDSRLEDDLIGLADDPLGFVRYAFPWGEEGTLLAGFSQGPDKWQADILSRLAAGRRERSGSVKIAVASGHGIGKSALIAWIILWFMSTRPHPQVVATANTRTQLETKTWRELAKWHKLAINAAWFEWTSTKFYLKAHPETWFAAAVPWAKERSEAFAGTHEQHVLFVFDEASLIHESIWEVTEGAMTQAGSFWLAFGNPTRNTGRFHHCFHGGAHRWQTRQIDSRTCRMTDKAEIDKLISDNGEDSDYARIRVKGQFPRASWNQLISPEVVDRAASRTLPRRAHQGAPRVLGVDVARFGDDASVIIRRQGLAAWGLVIRRGLDLMTFASLVAREMDDFAPDAVFIDEGGLGGGVVDRLIQLGRTVIGINFGGQAREKERFANRRVEMWAALGRWLERGGSIPEQADLRRDLCGPEYGFNDSGCLTLESKKDMKRRGLASPDLADALALTFAEPVTPALPGEETETAEMDYDLFGRLGRGER